MEMEASSLEVEEQEVSSVNHSSKGVWGVDGPAQQQRDFDVAFVALVKRSKLWGWHS